MTVIDRRSKTQKGWQDLKHVSCTLFFPNDFCNGPDSHFHTCLLFSVENRPCFVIFTHQTGIHDIPSMHKTTGKFHFDHTLSFGRHTSMLTANKLASPLLLPSRCCSFRVPLSLSQINQKESNQSTIIMKCCTNSSNHEEIQFNLVFCRLEDLQTKILIQTRIDCLFSIWRVVITS